MEVSKKGKLEKEDEEEILPDSETNEDLEEEIVQFILDIPEIINEQQDWFDANKQYLPKEMRTRFLNNIEDLLERSRQFSSSRFTRANGNPTHAQLADLQRRIRELDNIQAEAKRYYESFYDEDDNTDWYTYLREGFRNLTGFGREGGCSVSNNSKKENCGCSKSLNPKRVTKNYNKIISHLEEHLAEKAGDPKDASQSKMLKKEVQKIKAEGSTPVSKLTKKDNLYKVSNPREVQKKAFEIYGKDAIIYKSDKPNKKYKIFDKISGKFVHFGDPKMEDFNKHKDPERRQRYLKRALNIKGKWRDNPYSPNMLATVLLWDAE